MKPINYEIKNPFLFPFEQGLQHLRIAFSKEPVEWKGRVVHFLIGGLEMLPLVNYIIAIADRLLNPTWIWDVTTAEINFDALPLYDQSDIDLPKINVRLPGIGIGIGHKEELPESCRDVLPLPNYSWFEIFERDDFTTWSSLIRERNKVIIQRMSHPMMRGVDVDGNPLLFISRPTSRPEKTFELFPSRKVTRTYIGNEVIIIFKTGAYISLCNDSLGDCFSKISRLPEASRGLLKVIS